VTGEGGEEWVNYWELCRRIHKFLLAIGVVTFFKTNWTCGHQTSECSHWKTVNLLGPLNCTRNLAWTLNVLELLRGLRLGVLVGVMDQSTGLETPGLSRRTNFLNHIPSKLESYVSAFPASDPMAHSGSETNGAHISEQSAPKYFAKVAGLRC
jgi:hypothetical protein